MWDTVCTELLCASCFDVVHVINLCNVEGDRDWINKYVQLIDY